MIFLFGLVIAATTSITGCGGSEVAEKAIRQSERFYEAGSISWFDEGDSLAAIRNLTRAVETNPDNDEAQYLLGIVRLGRGEYEEAEKHLALAVKLRSNGRDPAGLAGAQNNLGVLYLHQKRYDEAVLLLKQSAEEVMNREPWLAYGNLGWAYTELGEYDKAVAALKRAMFDQPKYCVGLYRLGRVFYLKQDYPAASAYLNQAIQTPEEGCNRIQEAYQFLGMTQLRQERFEEAKQTFQKCRDLSPITTSGIECQSALESL